MDINLTLQNKEYEKLESLAKVTGKPVKKLISDLIHDSLKSSRLARLMNDPLYNIKNLDSNAPSDLSKNIDKYIYNN